jgi:hypothetical protein
MTTQEQIANLEKWASEHNYYVETEAKAGSDRLWIVTLKHNREPRKFSSSFSGRVPHLQAYYNALVGAVEKATAWEGRK